MIIPRVSRYTYKRLFHDTVFFSLDLVRRFSLRKRTTITLDIERKGALSIGAQSVLVRNCIDVRLTLSFYIPYGFQLRYRVLQNGLILERLFVQTYTVLEAKVNL